MRGTRSAGSDHSSSYRARGAPRTAARSRAPLGAFPASDTFTSPTAPSASPGFRLRHDAPPASARGTARETTPVRGGSGSAPSGRPVRGSGTRPSTPAGPGRTPGARAARATTQPTPSGTVCRPGSGSPATSSALAVTTIIAVWCQRKTVIAARFTSATAAHAAGLRTPGAGARAAAGRAPHCASPKETAARLGGSRLEIRRARNADHGGRIARPRRRVTTAAATPPEQEGPAVRRRPRSPPRAARRRRR
ncbi:hypothetical protein SCYAM73S_00699 [Streptomyces cyaneofuscatus]